MNYESGPHNKWPTLDVTTPSGQQTTSVSRVHPLCKQITDIMRQNFLFLFFGGENLHFLKMCC
jgi:hypothetical protein